MIILRCKNTEILQKKQQNGNFCDTIFHASCAVITEAVFLKGGKITTILHFFLSDCFICINFAAQKDGNTTPIYKNSTMKYSKLDKALQAWNDLQPLSERDRLRLSRRFTVDFNFNSNHIEGNTLTYGQTELLLLFGKVIGTAEMHDLEEMKASNVGLKMMMEEANMQDTPLTQSFIRTLHQTLLREDYTVYRNLPGGVQTSYVIHAGQYKTRPNSVITRYGDRFEYASPEETPALMTDLVNWYNDEEEKGELSPLELAALFHYRYIRIHPFEDGNGRIARLMVNFILSRHGWPMVVVRTRKKADYLEALHETDLLTGNSPSEGAHAEINEIKPFLRFFTGMILEEVTADIQFVTEHDRNVWWYDGERIAFRSPNYATILYAMQTMPSLSISQIQEITGINTSAIQKLLNQLISKRYVERNETDGGWRVFITPSEV